eukprot:GHRR01007326.1.p5 GENE.GHRR01007326.1~~GHRR01007326.1.p5  ORF type:complete len:109 (-),score=40.42 GHRR01007326.1:1418-1744(-)
MAVACCTAAIHKTCQLAKAAGTACGNKSVATAMTPIHLARSILVLSDWQVSSWTLLHVHANSSPHSRYKNGTIWAQSAVQVAAAGKQQVDVLNCLLQSMHNQLSLNGS